MIKIEKTMKIEDEDGNIMTFKSWKHLAQVLMKHKGWKANRGDVQDDGD